MARIRTVKPDFFTSEDIVSLTPHARLFYIALWCEADREGRLSWRLGTFKLRYFPADEVSIEELAKQLIERGLVRLYGEGLAHIPTFLEHQHINPREAASALPAPPPVDNSTRAHASSRVTDAQVGRKEGKGREGRDASGRVEVKTIVDKSKPEKINGDAWWKTEGGIEAKGKELDVPTQRGESWTDYKNRIFEKLNAAKAA